MKRLNITLFAMFVAMISYAQTTSGVWNSTTSTYTNTQHGIRWKLIEEWDWEERPILSRSTILKVRNNDTRILISLDVRVLEKKRIRRFGTICICMNQKNITICRKLKHRERAWCFNIPNQ